MYPDTWNAKAYGRLLANDVTLQAVLRGDTIAEIEAAHQLRKDQFLARRARFLLYD